MAVIVPPIFQLLVFGYAATFDLEHAALAILNEDTGGFFRDLAGQFERSSGFEVVGYLRSEAEIAALIDRGGALLALHIGPQCSSDGQGRWLQHPGADRRPATPTPPCWRSIIYAWNLIAATAGVSFAW